MGRRKKATPLYDRPAEDMKGYVIIPRAVFTLIEKGELTPFEAACDLLYQTTCKPSIVAFGKNKEQVQLGENEKNISERFLSLRWGWSRGWIRHFTDLLSKLNLITKRVETRNGKAMSIFKKSPLELPLKSPHNSPTKSPSNNTNNQGVTKTNEPSNEPLNSGNSRPDNSPNTIHSNSSSNKEKNSKNLEEETKEPLTHIQVWEKNKKEFINYLKTDQGKHTWELIISGDSRIKEKGYTQKEMLQEIHNMFVRWLNSNHDAERRRLHDSDYKKVGHLQNWLTSHYRKSAKQVKKQQERNREDKTNNLYPIEEYYSEARYTQLYSLLDDQRKSVITNILKREGKNRAFRTLKEYCISANLIDAA